MEFDDEIIKIGFVYRGPTETMLYDGCKRKTVRIRGKLIKVNSGDVVLYEGNTFLYNKKTWILINGQEEEPDVLEVDKRKRSGVRAK